MLEPSFKRAMPVSAPKREIPLSPGSDLECWIRLLRCECDEAFAIDCSSSDLIESIKAKIHNHERHYVTQTIYLEGTKLVDLWKRADHFYIYIYSLFVYFAIDFLQYQR